MGQKQPRLAKDKQTEVGSAGLSRLKMDEPVTNTLKVRWARAGQDPKGHFLTMMLRAPRPVLVSGMPEGFERPRTR